MRPGYTVVSMDAQDWDDRYAQADMVWGTPPNPVVVEFATSLPAGPGAGPRMR